jgi:hypothetical protein
MKKQLKFLKFALILLFNWDLHADVLRTYVKVNGDPNSPSISGVVLKINADKTVEAVYSGSSITSENLGKIEDISADFNDSGIINIRSKSFPNDLYWHITIVSGINSSVGERSSHYVALIAKYFQWLRLGLATSISIQGGISTAPVITVTVN